MRGLSEAGVSQAVSRKESASAQSAAVSGLWHSGAESIAGEWLADEETSGGGEERLRLSVDGVSAADDQ